MTRTNQKSNSRWVSPFYAKFTSIFVKYLDKFNFYSFKAHKLLLSLRSPVFRAMFHGPLRDETGTVDIDDVAPKAFEAMLKHIYKGSNSDEGSSEDRAWIANPANAWQLWYAAKKYMLDSLEEKCRKVGFK